MSLDDLKISVKNADLDAFSIAKSMIDMSFGLEYFALESAMPTLDDLQPHESKSCFLSISITRDLLGHCGAYCTKNCPVSCTNGSSML